MSPEATNVLEAAQRAFRRGKKQAGSIVLFIDKDDVSMDNVNMGIRNALWHDWGELVRELRVIDRAGRLQTISRREFLDGRRFQ